MGFYCDPQGWKCSQEHLFWCLPSLLSHFIFIHSLLKNNNKNKTHNYLITLLGKLTFYKHQPLMSFLFPRMPLDHKWLLSKFSRKMKVMGDCSLMVISLGKRQRKARKDYRHEIASNILRYLCSWIDGIIYYIHMEKV